MKASLVSKDDQLSRLARLAVIGLAVAGCVGSDGGQESGPIVRVDHFYAVSAEPEALLSFLMNELALPVAWPFGDFGSFASGAVSLGNVALEVVREEGTLPGDPTRLLGIALEPSGNAAAAIRWLEGAAVPHGEPRAVAPDGGPVQWENVELLGLLPGGTVFICDYKEREAVLDFQHDAAQQLADRNGGPLGVEGVRELVLRTSDLAESRNAWARAIGRGRMVGDAARFAVGPSVRLESGQTPQFAEVVIAVRSLEAASEYLERTGLLASRDDATLVIETSATQGLVLRLVEGL